MRLRSLSPLKRIAGMALCLCVFAGGHAQAGSLAVVLDAGGGNVADAVVSLHSPQAATVARPAGAVIDQRDTQFQPRVSVVHVGSRVEFPNSDNVRHQVYSFSPAKRFQLPLYSGKAAAPVTFDTPGVVELGCNIHDWMIAYIVVLDSPYHAIADAGGRVRLEAPPGRYRLRAWHPHLVRGAPVVEQDVVVPAGAGEVRVSLPLQAQAPRQGPGDEKLRELQERFRKLKRER